MDAREFINNYFNAYKHTSDYKDRSMMDIMAKRSEFEKISTTCGKYTLAEIRLR